MAAAVTCHPWLAASVSCLIGALLVSELAPLVRQHGPPGGSPESGLLGVKLRSWFRGRIAPVAGLLIRLGVSADFVTFSQLATSIASAVAYAQGWMFTAGWILIASGTLDVLDGQMARSRGEAGPRGAFIDSVVDRYGESIIFAGLVAFFRDTWVLWGILAAWSGSFLVSYTRARAESLGIDCREGLLQRPERYVILGGSSMLGTLAAHLSGHLSERDEPVAAAILALAFLAHITALQRARGTLKRFT